MDTQQIEHLRDLVAALKRRLQVLELQAAQFGSACPAYIIVEIEQTKEQIAEFAQQINRKALGVERQVNQIDELQTQLGDDLFLFYLISQDTLSHLDSSIDNIERTLRSIELKEKREFRIFGISIWSIVNERTFRLLLFVVLCLGATRVAIEGFPSFSSLIKPTTVAQAPTNISQPGAATDPPVPGQKTAQVTQPPPKTTFVAQAPTNISQPGAATDPPGVSTEVATLESATTPTPEPAFPSQVALTPIFVMPSTTGVATSPSVTISTVNPDILNTIVAILMSTATPTLTPTAILTATPTPSSTPTNTPTLTPTNTLTPTPTNTLLPTLTAQASSRLPSRVRRSDL